MCGRGVAPDSPAHTVLRRSCLKPRASSSQAHTPLISPKAGPIVFLPEARQGEVSLGLHAYSAGSFCSWGPCTGHDWESYQNKTKSKTTRNKNQTDHSRGPGLVIVTEEHHFPPPCGLLLTALRCLLSLGLFLSSRYHISLFIIVRTFIAVMKHHDQSNLGGEERVYLVSLATL